MVDSLRQKRIDDCASGRDGFVPVAGGCIWSIVQYVSLYGVKVCSNKCHPQVVARHTKMEYKINECRGIYSQKYVHMYTAHTHMYMYFKHLSGQGGDTYNVPRLPTTRVSCGDVPYAILSPDSVIHTL